MPDCLNLEGFSGGYDYNYHRRGEQTGYVHWWNLGNVVDVDVSSLLGAFELNKSAESDKLIEFPNGYYIKVLFTYKGDSSLGSNCYIQTDTKIYDNNDNLVPSLVIPGVTFGMQGAIASGTSYAYMYPFKHYKVCLNTLYYPSILNSAANPSGVAFQVFTSGTDDANTYDEGGNPLDAVASGASINEWDDLVHYTTAVSHRYGLSNLIAFTEAGINNFNEWLKNNGNPYSGGGFSPDKVPAGSDDNSEPGGGDGNYDDTSDPIDFPDLPTGGALECGAVIAHRVSKQTIEAIFSKLWNNSIFDPGSMWQKSLQNPMDAIVSLHALPCSPEVDGSTNIDIGNFNTELSSPEVTSQYLEIDCGTKKISEYWGSALDYSPYTRAEIYLPFIGIKDIAVEDIMQTTIHIKYYIDVLTGECIAFIKCGLSVLYHFKGNCKMSIPLSASTMDLIQNTLGAMGHIVSSAAMGAAVGGGAGALAGTVMSSAANVASTKIRTTKSDDMSGASSLMDDYVPYFILHRPIQSLAKDYNKFKGYPSNITSLLGNLKGYTEVEHINLQNIPNATEAEMVEIKNLLKQGVLL